MALLAVENVEASYKSVQVLHGISFHVAEGEIVTLIGANGAGKSSTLRAISGLLGLRRGEIHFQGRSIHHLPPHEIAAMGVAHAPEGRKIFPRMTVAENLEMGAFTRSDSAQISEDLDFVMTLFPRLKERLTQSGGTLSGGEQQMLAIARALMGRPKLLMLDEPSLGLAPILVRAIFQTIVRISAQGTTILLVEQNAHMALAVAHRAYVLETGRIILEGPASDLACDKKIREAYLGL